MGKRLFLHSALCCGLLFFFCSFSQNEWHYFRSTQGRFKILIPGTFTEKINTVRTSIGEVEYHTFIHQSSNNESDNLVYLVSYCDYPSGTIHADSTDVLKEFFDVTIDAATKSVKGELIYANDITVKSHPGKFWRIDYNQGTAVIKSKAFLVGNRYFSVQTVSLKEKSMNSATSKFMDSFQLLERVPN